MASLNNQLKQIEKQLTNKIQDALQKEVADAVSERMKMAIKVQVYDSYSPKVYERRYDRGGLVDDSNIKPVARGNKLIVKNITMSNEEYLPKGKKPYKIAGVIEYGGGKGYGEYDYYGLRPRPFLEATRKDLIKNKQHISAMKVGLKRQGIDVL